MVLFWSGQTWLFTILHLMKNSDKLLEGQTIEKMDRLDFPFMETKFPGGPLMHEIAARKQGPRILKTHLPLCYWKDALDRSPETKVIQTIHNPKDTLVSFYHFHRMNKLLGCLNGTWDEFFEMKKLKPIFPSRVSVSSRMAVASKYRSSNFPISAVR